MPNKIKHFMWRSCKNILPTKHRLKSKGIIKEDECDFCVLSESSVHTLWDCKVAVEVWGAIRLKCHSFKTHRGILLILFGQSGRKNLRWIESSSQQHPGVYGTIEISSGMEDNVRRLARLLGKLLSTSRSLDKMNYLRRNPHASPLSPSPHRGRVFTK